MGRASLVLVMGLAVAFAIIGTSMRRATEMLVVAQTGYAKYTYARNLARLAVHTTLRAFDRGLPTIPRSGSVNEAHTPLTSDSMLTRYGSRRLGCM